MAMAPKGMRVKSTSGRMLESRKAYPVIMPRMRKIHLLFWIALLLVCCSKPKQQLQHTIRLADLYKASALEGATKTTTTIPPTIWRFGSSDLKPNSGTTGGWVAQTGVRDLKIQDGKLTGTSTDPIPIISVEREMDPNDRDLFYALEVRLKVSAGQNLSFDFSDREKVDIKRVLGYMEAFAWPSTPLIADNQFHTYTVHSPFSTDSSGMRHLMLRPTDAVGATFEIESVRIIFRKEYLAGIASGVSWQGLSGVYQETIVSRSAERIRLTVKPPDNAWLDLNIGTVEDVPITFHVEAMRTDHKLHLLMERTLTTPHRWETAQLDLHRYAGQTTDLVLSITSEHPGALGFWGSAAVRSNGWSIRRVEGGSDRKAPQNVILVWTDTLRRDHLSLYGYNRDTSPHISKMASEGVVF